MKAIKSTHFTDYIQIIYEQFTKKNPHSLKEKKKGGGVELHIYEINAKKRIHRSVNTNVLAKIIRS